MPIFWKDQRICFRSHIEVVKFLDAILWHQMQCVDSFLWLKEAHRKELFGVSWAFSICCLPCNTHYQNLPFSIRKKVFFCWRSPTLFSEGNAHYSFRGNNQTGRWFTKVTIKIWSGRDCWGRKYQVKWIYNLLIVSKGAEGKGSEWANDFE